MSVSSVQSLIFHGLFTISAFTPLMAVDRQPVFGLDLGGLAEGNLEPADMEKATIEGQWGRSPVRLHFSADGAGTAEIVTLPGGEKALRLRPEPSNNGRWFAVVGVEDAGLGPQLNVDAPVFIEIKLRRSFGPIPAILRALFKRDEGVFQVLGALGGQKDSETSYRVLQTSDSPEGKWIQGTEIPAEETVTLLYELSRAETGLQVITSIAYGGATVFDNRSEPVLVENVSINGLERFQIVLSAGQEITGDEFLDLLSISAWQ